jgi:hypothetical protein
MLNDGFTEVAPMEVSNFPALVDAVFVSEAHAVLHNQWTMGLRGGERIPLLNGKAVSERHTTGMTRREALALSGDKKRWVVRHLAWNKNILQELDPLQARAGRVCLLVTKVTSVPRREPLVEAVVCQQGNLHGAPTLVGGITDITHVRIPFHGLVFIALNARVWADVATRPDGPRELARIVPSFLGREANMDRTLWGYGQQPRVACPGLDVQLANGQRVDLRKVQLHQHPWPKRPTKVPK